jgi:hypothetical protein
MNKSQRIELITGTTTTDKHIIVRLEQNVDTLEFMSLNISTKDAYQDFNSDYGVLIGRVIANGGVGIPNAKISIFIPLTDTDAEDGTITSIYPYKTPRDKNAQGKRYNLLPRVSVYDQVSGVYSPKQPFGSFPIKPEIVANQYFLDVYKKYYKYTAVTNDAGDYMIFGVPIGTQTVHLSIDITDIGKYSMNPASMVTNLGYSPNLFTENNSKIKPSDDLSDLPNIETQEISVNIIPFWGDTTNFIIGITRQDFRIRATLVNTFIIFGSTFTDDSNAMWGMTAFDDRKIDELYTMGGDDLEFYRISVSSKKIGKVTEKIYSYPSNVTDYEIDNGIANPIKQMILLDPSQYSTYKRDGDFVLIINCNRKKIVTDDFSRPVEVSADSPNGIFTEFRGFITLEITNDDIPLDWTSTIGAHTTVTPIRAKLKFPQQASINQSFWNYEGKSTINWRKQNYTFSGGSIYSIAKFYGTVYNNTDDNDVIDEPSPSATMSYANNDVINLPYGLSAGRNPGVIITNDVTNTDGVNIVTGNDNFEMIPNVITTAENFNFKMFGANWLNFTAYLPQYGYVSNGYSYVHNWRSNTNFQSKGEIKSTFYYEDNTQPIAADQFNTKWFARSDLHWTDFINVPKADIVKMANEKKGFTGNTTAYVGNYRNGVDTNKVPYQGGRLNGNGLAIQDPKTYFYKGVGDSNCIEFLISLGLV